MRILADATPCRATRGCPKGTPESPRSLNERNERAYWHYQMCRAVGRFPRDETVRQNAAIIARAQKQIADLKQRELTELIKCLILKRA